MSSPRKKYSFDIEHAIATWRQFLLRERSVSEEDLKELEAHLRDEMIYVRRPDMSDEEVYRRALKSIGDYSTVGSAYRDVYWDKKTGTAKMIDEIRWRLGLFGSNIIAAARYFMRHKKSAIVNLLGLTLGITSSFLLLLFVYDELSYDSYHENADRVYRVVQEVTAENFAYQGLIGPGPLGPALVDEFPEIENAVRFNRLSGGEVLIARNDVLFFEDQFFFTDQSVFDLFSVPLLVGNPAQALTRPFTVVITEEIAQKIFGSNDVVGEVIQIKGIGAAHDFEITGVAENPPHNTHLHYRILASYDSQRQIVPYPENLDSWGYVGQYTYVLAEPEASIKDLREKTAAFVEKYDPSRTALREQSGTTATYDFVPLTDIHLKSHHAREIEANGDPKILYILSTIAFLILVLACVNYINLTTAACGQRMGEIGVRKAIGANRRQLSFQFLTESLLLVGIAMIAAFVIIVALLPSFNAFTGKTIELATLALDKPAFLFLVLGLGFTIVAGVYPSLLMSSLHPAIAIRGGISDLFSKSFLRQGLVVFQFIVSIALVAGTLTIRDQLRYMQTKDLGLNTEQIVVVKDPGIVVRDQFPAFRDELLKSADILNVTISQTSLPVSELSLWFMPRDFEGTEMRARAISAGPYFIETLDLRLLAGGDLPMVQPPDYKPVLINKAAAKRYGWSDPIGKKFMRGTGTVDYRVVGMVEDFHYQPLREAIAPLVIMSSRYGSHLLVRVNTDDISSTLGIIESNWRQFAPGQPFTYSFLDESYDQQFKADERLANTLNLFSLLAIVIACLGLYALASYTAELRIKEIGIRKVLGASHINIVSLLVANYVILVGIAIVVTTPIIYPVMNIWLQDFAYRVDVSWITIGVAGVSTLALAIATVLFESIRSASANPVESLRYE